MLRLVKLIDVEITLYFIYNVIINKVISIGKYVLDS